MAGKMIVLQIQTGIVGFGFRPHVLLFFAFFNQECRVFLLRLPGKGGTGSGAGVSKVIVTSPLSADSHGLLFPAIS